MQKYLARLQDYEARKIGELTTEEASDYFTIINKLEEYLKRRGIKDILDELSRDKKGPIEILELNSRKRHYEVLMEQRLVGKGIIKPKMPRLPSKTPSFEDLHPNGHVE